MPTDLVVAHVVVLDVISSTPLVHLPNPVDQVRENSNSEEFDLGNTILATSRKLAAAKNFFSVNLCMTY